MTIRYVLITRPEDESESLKAAAALRGFAPLCAPMLVIKLLPEKVPDLTRAQAVVFTSAQAVKAVAVADRVARDVPVYAVGEKTANMAKMAGFRNVTAPAGDAGGMAALIVLMARSALKGDKPVMHLSGREIAAPVALPGVRVERHIVYQADKIGEFPPEVVQALRAGHVAAALFLSARTAESFVDALRRAKLTDCVKSIKALCISDSVLQSVRHLPWQGTAVADTPHIENMAALLEDPAL